MNRFRIAPGKGDEFISIWKNRETHLATVPGFREFHLLQGPEEEGYTLFASHSVWDSEQTFIDWTKSEAFRQAHASAGQARDIYLGPPQFEGFHVVL
jgi:heme-degrading monooxygenase HmoA